MAWPRISTAGIPLLKSKERRAKRKEKRIVPRGTILFSLLFGLLVENVLRGTITITIPYRPNLISSTFTSAGDTPGMREACPMVCGRIRDSFWPASMVNEFIAIKR